MERAGEALNLRTGRGAYRMRLAGDPERIGSGLWLTVSLERADGVERFALRCLIGQEEMIGEAVPPPARLLERVAAKLQPQFEQVREAALRAARAEHRLWEVRLDAL